MISGAIWCKEARVKFSKTTKLSEPAGRVQLLILEKASQRVETDAILAARAICNLHLCYNFAPELHENVLVLLV